MRKSCLIVAVALLVITVRGDDDLAWLEQFYCIKSIKRTPTHLVIKFTSEGALTVVSPKGKPGRLTSEYAEKGEDLILDPVCEIALSDMHHFSVSFTPVLYKNKMKGFRIVDRFDARAFGDGIITNNLVHVALGKKNVKVGEEDVLEDLIPPRPPELSREVLKEILKAEEKQREEIKRMTSLPNHEEVVAITKIEEPTAGMKIESSAAIAEDEPAEEKRTIPSGWLYSLIPLCILAALYFLRRRTAKNK